MLAIIQKAGPFCKGKPARADAMFMRVFTPPIWRGFLYGPLKAQQPLSASGPNKHRLGLLGWRRNGRRRRLRNFIFEFVKH
jgi:hypothetical protein